MRPVADFHMHTVFCDGKNTPEEILEKAIELGFDSIGFSSHAKSIPLNKTNNRTPVSGPRTQKKQIKKYAIQIF